MKKIHSISQRVVIIDAFHAYLLLSSSSALSSSLFRPSVDFFSAVFQTVYDTAQTHWAAAAAAPPNTKLSTNTTEKEKRERRIRNPGCSTETIRFVSEVLLDIDQRFSLSLSLSCIAVSIHHHSSCSVKQSLHRLLFKKNNTMQWAAANTNDHQRLPGIFTISWPKYFNWIFTSEMTQTFQVIQQQKEKWSSPTYETDQITFKKRKDTDSCLTKINLWPWINSISFIWFSVEVSQKIVWKEKEKREKKCYFALFFKNGV